MMKVSFLVSSRPVLSSAYFACEGAGLDGGCGSQRSFGIVMVHLDVLDAKPRKGPFYCGRTLPSPKIRQPGPNNMCQNSQNSELRSRASWDSQGYIAMVYWYAVRVP